METLLIPDYPILLLPQLAVRVGLNQAVFLQQLHYWLIPKPRYMPHQREYEGVTRPWTFNQYKARQRKDGSFDGWEYNFPFWSTRTIQRVVKTLIIMDLIIVTDEFNAKKSNNTPWYTIKYEEVSVVSGQSGNACKPWIREVSKIARSVKLEDLTPSKILTPSQRWGGVKLSPPPMTSCHPPHDNLSPGGCQVVTPWTETTSETKSNIPTNKKIDPLDHIVGFPNEQKGMTEPTEFEKHFGTRNVALQIFHDAAGVVPLAPAAKALVVNLANGPDFNADVWQRAVESCIVSGVRKDNVQCLVDTYYAGGDYGEMLRKSKSKRKRGSNEKPKRRTSTRSTPDTNPEDSQPEQSFDDWLAESNGGS